MGHKKLFIVATLIALSVVGFAWYVRSASQEAARSNEPQTVTDGSLVNIRDIQKEDHVLGNPAAPLVFIVYSDFQCPFCKESYEIMHNIIRVYGVDGGVAWVFRHMPLAQLHPQSPTYALASECVAYTAPEPELAFWKFADAMFEKMQPDNNVVTTSEVTALAQSAGAPKDAFLYCMKNNLTLQKVQRDYEEAVASGANASPYTVVLTQNQRFVVTGVISYKKIAEFITRSQYAHAPKGVPRDGR